MPWCAFLDIELAQIQRTTNFKPSPNSRWQMTVTVSSREWCACCQTMMHPIMAPVITIISSWRISSAPISGHQASMPGSGGVWRICGGIEWMSWSVYPLEGYTLHHLPTPNDLETVACYCRLATWWLLVPAWSFSGLCSRFFSKRRGRLLHHLSLILVFSCPWSILVLYGGKVWGAAPWLIGIEGTLPIREIELMTFG